MRSCVDALNRRDLDAYLACCKDDVELRTVLVALEGPHQGADGIRRFLANLEDTAPDFWLDIERLEAVGPDRVLVFDRASVSGRISEASVEEGIPFAAVYDLADGKVERVRVFADRQEALDAVGLTE